MKIKNDDSSSATGASPVSRRDHLVAFLTEYSAVTVYREHPGCYRLHRSYATLAKCLFRRSVYQGGEGPWAVLGCHYITVSLYETEAEAREMVRWLNETHCSGQCLGVHRVIKLAVEVGTAS